MEELIKRLERVIQTGAPDKDGQHPISAEAVLEVVKELYEHGTNLAEVGTDCISRQAAIDLVKDVCDAIMSCCGSHYDEETDDEVYDDIREIDAILKCNKEMRIALKNMPSAEPERKMGKWIYNSPVTMKCDQCGFVIKDWDWHHFKFCPNCDCDIRGEQE